MKELDRRRHLARIGALRMMLDGYRLDVDEGKIEIIKRVYELLIRERYGEVT